MSTQDVTPGVHLVYEGVVIGTGTVTKEAVTSLSVRGPLSMPVGTVLEVTGLHGVRRRVKVCRVLSSAALVGETGETEMTLDLLDAIESGRNGGIVLKAGARVGARSELERAALVATRAHPQQAAQAASEPSVASETLDAHPSPSQNGRRKGRRRVT